MICIEAFHILGRRVLGDSNYTALIPGSHLSFVFACGDFGAEYCKEINEGESLQHWEVEGGRIQQIPRESGPEWQETRKVVERVKGLLVETGVQGSNTPGIAHSDQRLGRGGAPWWTQICLQERTVQLQGSAHLAFRTSLCSSWGWLWLMTEPGSETRAYPFPPFHPTPIPLAGPGGLAEMVRSHHSLKALILFSPPLTGITSPTPAPPPINHPAFLTPSQHIGFLVNPSCPDS